MDISDIVFPEFERLSLLCNSHKEAGLDIPAFITSQKFPISVASADDMRLLLSGQATELWIAVWFESGDVERNECNLQIASSFKGIIERLMYYKQMTESSNDKSE